MARWLIVLALLIATPALAHEYGRYNYRSNGYRYQLPRREVTTIERTGNRTRIERRYYYRGDRTARMKTSSGAWSARSR